MAATKNKSGGKEPLRVELRMNDEKQSYGQRERTLGRFYRVP